MEASHAYLPALIYFWEICNPAWTSKGIKELSDELRKTVDDNNVDHNRMAIELITPRGKAMAFLKVTFLTESERQEATKKLITTRASHGNII